MGRKSLLELYDDRGLLYIGPTPFKAKVSVLKFLVGEYTRKATKTVMAPVANRRVGLRTQAGSTPAPSAT